LKKLLDNVASKLHPVCRISSDAELGLEEFQVPTMLAVICTQAEPMRSFGLAGRVGAALNVQAGVGATIDFSSSDMDLFCLPTVPPIEPAV
jgi:hypothetical protein